MNITLDCIPCFVRHTNEVLKEFNVDDSIKEKVMREVLARMAKIDFGLTPPEFAAVIHAFIREQLNCDDPYKKIKDDSNVLAQELTEKLRKHLKKTDNLLRNAVLYSIAGNIIDSGVSAVTSLDDILISIEMAEKETPAIDNFLELEAVFAKANSILILGDNAGEIFFDKLLIENIAGSKKIYYAVKGGPVLNDATREDARFAGLDKYVEIIDNGTRIPGTALDQVSPEFLNVFNQADVILSKGQANYETLSGIKDDRIFFLLRAKCDVIADKAGVPKGSFVIAQNLEEISSQKSKNNY
ncbi:MAG: damage-control phosphatase ARMT1 family protein [Candidatus Rifleibacteriota bacterium]